MKFDKLSNYLDIQLNIHSCESPFKSITRTEGPRGRNLQYELRVWKRELAVSNEWGIHVRNLPDLLKSDSGNRRTTKHGVRGGIMKIENASYKYVGKSNVKIHANPQSPNIGIHAEVLKSVKSQWHRLWYMTILRCQNSST